MLGKIEYLSIILCFGYTISPLVCNHFFLENSKLYKQFYYVALVSVFLSIGGYLPQLSFIWLFYCGFGLHLYINIHKKKRFINKHWLGLLPFLFSLISATWFVSGTNDFQLLGYDKTWSFYASIHGCFIGWLYLSGICYLAIKHRNLVLPTVFVGFISSLFLVIAIGIDQWGGLKKFGVIGYLILFPVIILYILNVLKPKLLFSKFLYLIHFISILFSLSIALGKELALFDLDQINSEFMMHFLHGGINAIVVIPSFLMAILNEEKNEPSP